MRTGMAPATRRKLKGEEIPLTARILTIVDVFDALTTDRPYRPANDGGKGRRDDPVAPRRRL